MKPNPPITGHELLYEGAARRVGAGVRGGCRCGAMPPGWPNVSRKAVQTWHRAHKAQLRRDVPAQPDWAALLRQGLALHEVSTAEHLVDYWPPTGDHECSSCGGLPDGETLCPTLLWRQAAEQALATLS